MAPPAAAQPREQRERAPVDFGAAVTHRDAVREQARVDPAARAERQRKVDPLRRRDQRDGRRDSRDEPAGDDAQDAPPGQLVDIKV